MGNRKVQNDYFIKRKDFPIDVQLKVDHHNKLKAIEEFRKFDLEPIEIEQWKEAKTLITCLNQEGLKVQASLTRLRAGSVPNAFRNNPFKMENVERLAAQHGITLLPGQEYEEYHQPFWGIQDDYKVLFRIQKLLKSSLPSPFHSNNKYALENIQTLCKKLELMLTIPLDQTYRGTNMPVLAKDELGYKLKVRVFDLKKGKTPNPFHLNNPYRMENAQHFCDILGFKIKIKQNQKFLGSGKPLIATNNEGYNVNVVLDNMKKSKIPSAFHPSNPHTLDNINLYCKKYRPDYELLPDQIYENAKAKLKFKYLKKGLPVGVKRTFEVSWSNFKQGKGHSFDKESKK